MRRKQSRFLKQQKMVFSIVAILFLAIIGYVSIVVLKDAVPFGNYVAGEQYSILENPRRVRGNRIEVIEFFSYACPYCYRFEPELVEWVDENQDRIKFIRSPLVSNDTSRRLARHYYSLEKLGLLDELHLKFFSAVHDRRLNISTPARLEKWAGENGAGSYSEVFASGEIQRRVEAADQLARQLQIANVPSMIVQGQYAVNVTETVGLTRMLDIVEHLVQMEIDKRSTTDE